MHEGQAINSGGGYREQDIAKLQAVASQGFSGNLPKQRDQSPIEQSLDRLAKNLEFAVMNADALIERLAPVSCAQPTTGNGANSSLTGGSCHIESRIESLADRISNLAQKLVDHREALRI